MAQEIEDDARRAHEASMCARLAAGLRMSPNLETAASLTGVTLRGPELEALAERARREHEQLITGDMRETAHLAEGVIHLFMLEVLERRGAMTPRDLVLFLGFAADARKSFLGDGPEQNWISINLSVEPPRPLTEEERERIHGKEAQEARGSQKRESGCRSKRVNCRKIRSPHPSCTIGQVVSTASQVGSKGALRTSS
jgi:hypothetical protein